MVEVSQYTDSCSLDSSVLSKAWYDQQEGNLFLEFTNGTRAGYRGVPLQVYLDLSVSSSAGRVYNRFIKDRYAGLAVGTLDHRSLFTANDVVPTKVLACDDLDLAPVPVNVGTWTSNAISVATNPMLEGPTDFEIILRVQAQSASEALTTLSDEQQETVVAVTRAF